MVLVDLLYMHVVIEDHMLDWHSCQICYRLKVKLLLYLTLLLLLLLLKP